MMQLKSENGLLLLFFGVLERHLNYIFFQMSVIGTVIFHLFFI